ncbi:DNA-directed RNA polymerase I subunit RPA34 [Glycomyces sp. L485]|uniref:DNA-directed RNA polymerase I subunit RPA34 n=1 Tax=Glycomyces sp. L485 TaxID=2909235 RepID=UPI001F4A92FC|nr:DNA-directed RNA polymerase I subunit RPA34 [Glycomyces sp. L485]MCH7230432.1 DNA-directed RNA polymerase I subunit RPA34 [Glycomyces sp. L485]
MVRVSLRENTPGATDRNTFERHRTGPDRHLTEVPGDGFYDWAGRRLFLPDGSPDLATPGLDRHRHLPECTDPSAPDSDPSSPRYEPPHLRHRPGDTFEIGGRPHDPLDTGPYGTPDWRPDTRIGRHRRGELPDPLPSEDDKPSPIPRERRRLRTEPQTDELYRFSNLREDAWDRWLIDSEPLAAAHNTAYTAAQRSRTIASVFHLIRWIVLVFKGSRASNPTSEPLGPEDSEPAESLRRAPSNPAPRTGSHYITEWEQRFDSLHPAVGGGAL